MLEPIILDFANNLSGTVLLLRTCHDWFDWIVHT